MHLKAVSDVIFLLKEEKKKVGFWSLVVDVPLLIFSSFYFIFIKTTNRGRDISNFGPFFFFFVFCWLWSPTMVHWVVLQLLTVCITCTFLFTMLFSPLYFVTDSCLSLFLSSVCYNTGLLLGICNEPVQLSCCINRRNPIWAVQVLYASQFL